MNKLNLSFIMSSYGDDLRCKDVHASSTLKVAAGGKFNVPLAGTVPVNGTTAGTRGDIVFVTGATPATSDGVWVCTVAGGSTSIWVHTAAP